VRPKVLFVNPPSMPYYQIVQSLENKRPHIGNLARQQPIAMPMGILYLSAVLERDFPDIEIRILDYAKALREYLAEGRTDLDTIDEFVDLLLASRVPESFRPDMVGMSILFSTAHRTTCFIADRVKRRWPNAPIFVGGMHATNSVPRLLETPAIDYVCRGEAESIISKVLATCLEGGDCEAIRGIHGRKKLAAAQTSGGACRESADLIYDLDEIPYPAWHLLPMEEYVHSPGSRVLRVNDEVDHDREATIVTTRGCPFQCTFCSSWTVHGRKMRYRSTANVIGELEILHQRYHVNMVTPEDDLFSVKKPRIIELCNAIADHFNRKLHFQFPNALSVATLDREVIDAMVRMGMSVATIAIESGSPYVQKHVIKKNCDLDRARRVVKDARDAGAMVRTNFVVGFPGETKAQIRETFDFAASLATDWCEFSIAAPLVGTEMYQQMLDLGYIDGNFNWDTAFFRERQFDTPEVTAAELKAMVDEANIRINFFGNYNLKVGDYHRALQFFDWIVIGHAGHLAARYVVGMTKRMMGDEAAFQKMIRECKELVKVSPMAAEQLRNYPDLFPELAGELTAA
jgi:anaerobic magnesium-protoporphyrin IX monomethyl ester cyclase